MKTYIVSILALLAISLSSQAADKPNIIYILADDLGYGDVHCLNPKRGKIETPNLDKLAAQGIAFTDAHGSSSVCTPSRYSILTGRYNWRSQLQEGVLGQKSERVLIPPTRLTVAGLLKQQGYTTACIGKWHLGCIWPKKDGALDFTQPITGGPTAVGFDWYFGVNIPGYAPHCFIENDRPTVLPTATLPKEKTIHGGLAGPAAPGWTHESMLPTFTDKACDYIRRNAVAKKTFFLYFPLNSPHTPISPNKEWLGKSGLGRYADFVMETDAMVGRVMEAVEQSGIADNTLVIFASDNGCTPAVGVTDHIGDGAVVQLEKRGHFPSAQFRGYKADVWDGGHRIPFIARWPGVIKPGSTCRQLACQMDLMATCAEITGANIPQNAGEDSVSLLPLLKGEDRPVRETLVHHSFNGIFAIREGRWKLDVCPGSGGWSKPTDTEARRQKHPAVQLYDMSADEGERKNLQAEHPEIVKRLMAELEKIVADGRSTPGPKQTNDVSVDIFKRGK